MVSIVSHAAGCGAVSELLEGSMGKGRNLAADGVKARTDELIHYLRTETQASGPLTQGAAAHAIQAYETGAYWAVKALLEADAIEGDDGGGEPASKETDA
jgi:hypothetical protein